jgi:type II secretory pathway pseudopilin PulG
MLVVLAIIGLLAAILFPVLKTAREKGYQAACATNLQQIYLAVELYRRDVEEFPPSLKVLLSDTEELADGTLNTGGKGYFRGGKDALVCPDDDTDSTGLRSSYGDVGNPNKADFGNYVWNYWGYRVDQGTNCSDTDVSGCKGTAYSDAEVSGYPNPSDPETYINSDYATALGGKPAFQISGTTDLDITRLPRLANRFAPPSTIITHCVFHRLPSSNIAGAYDLYADTTNSQGAKDIILRLDGTAKVLDVSGANFADSSNWALQRF